MSDRDDEQSLWTVLLVTLGLVAMVVAGVLGIAIDRSMKARQGSSVGGDAGVVAEATQAEAASDGSAAAAAAPAARDLSVMRLFGKPMAVLYFDLGRSTVPANAAATLDKVVKAAGDKSELKIVLSGFHDASGDPQRNAELARERAQAVRTALVEKGLDASRVVLRKPEAARDDGPAREARRVEIRLVDAR